MRDSITRLTYQQIERNWSKKIKQEYEGLDSARDIKGFLANPSYTVTFRYALCRFLRECYGERKQGCPDIAVVTYGDFRAEFFEGPDSPLPGEIGNYITLMLKLAQDRGMKGEIQGKLLRKYLTGKQENVARDTLFKMAFAFGMDCEYVCELLESIDEVPYNFRDPRECIYYFCQYSETFNDWGTAQELIGWYEQGEKEEGGDDEGDGTYAGQSRRMEEHICMVLDGLEDPLEQKKALMDYLDAHRRELRGYSRAAYAQAMELLDELKEITGASDDTELSIRLWEPIWVQYYTKKAEKTGINRSDFVPFKDLLDLPRTVYEKPLWRARIRKLRMRQAPVEKRDILFLNCMRWALDRESGGGIGALREFILETNDILLGCGLSVIYPPNQYDRMILLAICSGSPYDVLADLFHVATDEKKLQEKLTC